MQKYNPEQALAEEKANIPVYYPGLKSHPQHDLIYSMINESYGYGGIIAIDCGTKEKSYR